MAAGVGGNGQKRPPVEEVRACLERLIQSPAFGNSRRRGELLRYLVERALRGEAGQVSEYAIGLDVFGKPESFDPRAESTVRSEMSRLRRSLTEYYQNGGSAETWRIDFPSRGYAATFLPAREPAAAKQRRTAWWRAGAAVALAVIAAVAWRLQPTRDGLNSVVVLPFANLTGDPGNDYLTDGITEDLTDALAQVSSLRVVARTSAFQFKGKGLDVREIGRRVNADAVIEGSLRRTDAGFTVTVQLNRATDGYHLLSRHFDGGASEMARMERDLSLPVLAALRPNAHVPGRPIPNPEAFDLLQKSRVFRSGGRGEAFEKTVSYLDQAIAKDPSYADAYAALAGVYVANATNGGADPVPSVERAKAAAAKALQLDPLSARAYASEGFADALILGNWKQGEDELRNAVRLQPQSAVEHQWLGQVMMLQGRFPEAAAEMERSESLDPLQPAQGAALGLCYFMARRYEDARRQWEKVVSLHPDFPLARLWIGDALLSEGRYEKASKQFASVPSSYDPLAVTIHKTYLLAVTGRKSEAQQSLTQLEASALEHDPLSLAAIAGVLGQRDLAFQWLDRAVEIREAWVLKVHPWFDSLRGDPRYGALLKRIHLAE